MSARATQEHLCSSEKQTQADNMFSSLGGGTDLNPKYSYSTNIHGGIINQNILRSLLEQQTTQTKTIDLAEEALSSIKQTLTKLSKEELKDELLKLKIKEDIKLLDWLKKEIRRQLDIGKFQATIDYNKPNWIQTTQ